MSPRRTGEPRRSASPRRRRACPRRRAARPRPAQRCAGSAPAGCDRGGGWRRWSPAGRPCGNKPARGARGQTAARRRAAPRRSRKKKREPPHVTCEFRRCGPSRAPVVAQPCWSGALVPQPYWRDARPKTSSRVHGRRSSAERRRSLFRRQPGARARPAGRGRAADWPRPREPARARRQAAAGGGAAVGATDAAANPTRSPRGRPRASRALVSRLLRGSRPNRGDCARGAAAGGHPVEQWTRRLLVLTGRVRADGGAALQQAGGSLPAEPARAKVGQVRDVRAPWADPRTAWVRRHRAARRPARQGLWDANRLPEASSTPPAPPHPLLPAVH